MLSNSLPCLETVSLVKGCLYKKYLTYNYKTTSKEFEFLHKGYATAVAMATMTFQDGGYFGFKVIQLVNDIGDPPILFKKMISLSIMNYFDNLKKFCGAKKIIMNNHLYVI